MTGEASIADGSGESGGRIEIHRDDDVRADSAASYRLLVDGEGRVPSSPSETHRLAVGPGPHRVQLTASRFWRSRPVEVDVAAGETVRMRCRPSAGLQASRLMDPGNFVRLVQELDPPDAPPVDAAD